MPHAEIPNFSVRKEGEPIPPVDAEDLRRRWNIRPPWPSEALLSADSHEADSSAVSRRDGIIRTLIDLNQGQLLAPWRRGEELDGAVFRVASTFPMWALRQGVYKIAGDEKFGFDPNAFVQRLIEETGISHVWEPIPTRIPEGHYTFGFTRATFKGQGPPDPEREAKRCARDVLWDVWSRYVNLHLSQDDRETFAHIVAILFADFVIDNVDLVRELTSLFNGGRSAQPFAVLTELERRAKGWKP
jgi:hypothetical protein